MHLKALYYLTAITAYVIVTNPMQANALQNNHTICRGNVMARPAQCPVIPDISNLPLDVKQSNIFFPHGGTLLDPHERHKLSILAKLLSTPRLSSTCIRLTGHTDISGSKNMNLKLGQIRAQLVADFLSSEITNHQHLNIEVTSKGEGVPIIGIPTASVAHRRVTIEARPCG